VVHVVPAASKKRKQAGNDTVVAKKSNKASGSARRKRARDIKAKEWQEANPGRVEAQRKFNSLTPEDQEVYKVKAAAKQKQKDVYKI
jgi:hypothetical protein